MSCDDSQELVRYLPISHDCGCVVIRTSSGKFYLGVENHDGSFEYMTISDIVYNSLNKTSQSYDEYFGGDNFG